MNDVKTAVETLKKGGLIAYPTEAVFGLGCDPFNESAVLRLLELKDRPVSKGLILIAANWSQLENLVLPISPERFAIVQKTWPGPYTWVFPASKEAPTWICGAHPNLAVRVTAHPVAKLLCAAFGGPLVSTSANCSGEEPARCQKDIIKLFNHKLDFIVSGKVGGLSKPTEIRDAETGQLLR